MTTHYYRIAANSMQADGDRKAMASAGLTEIVTHPYDGKYGSRFLTSAVGEINPGSFLPCAKTITIQ